MSNKNSYDKNIKHQSKVKKIKFQVISLGMKSNKINLVGCSSMKCNQDIKTYVKPLMCLFLLFNVCIIIITILKKGKFRVHYRRRCVYVPNINVKCTWNNDVDRFCIQSYTSHIQPQIENGWYLNKQKTMICISDLSLKPQNNIIY